MLRRISNICLPILLAISALAFGKGPVFNLDNMKPPVLKTEYGKDPLKAGDTLSVTVQIDSGWHINANVVQDEFLFPSKLEAKANGIRFGTPKWPEPQKAFNDALQIEALQFSGTILIRLPLDSVGGSYDSLSTMVTLHYQACSNSICLAPAKVSQNLGTPMPETGLKKNASDPSAQEQSRPTAPGRGFLLLLFFAFVGGLILNLMPCVLPVLSIKALSLAKHARESRSKLLAFGLAMTLGILVSFWTLATVILIVQKAGGAAGWGFQFQNPAFLVGMTVLTTLLALNLFGVFEIWLPSSAQTGISQSASRKGLLGAFMNGVLMTLLSTPCSAPFLGSAMGFAFSQPAHTLLLFFTAAALGLAFPYLMLSLFPQALRWIPKPGDWMVHFKQFLGFLMLATSAWLLWVLGRQVGIQAMGLLLLLLVVLGFGAWILGILATPGSSFWKITLGWMIVAALGFGGWITWLQPLLSQPVEPQTNSCEGSGLPAPDRDGWIAWSPQTLATLQAQGKTIFVDFTADWCITCKTNEKAVLTQDTIRQAFEQLGIVLLKADFTRADPEISKTLKTFGRSGVPLYVIYPGIEPAKPIVLSEILTVSHVLDALMQAGPSQP